MSIESTQFITRERAIEKIKYYLSLRNSGDTLEEMTDDQLDNMLHSLKYELDEDKFENYIIVGDNE